MTQIRTLGVGSTIRLGVGSSREGSWRAPPSNAVRRTWEMDLTHDRDLIRRMRGGDERAFEEFFGVYFPRLYRFAAARVRLQDAAEDIAQATIVAGHPESRNLAR